MACHPQSRPSLRIATGALLAISLLLASCATGDPHPPALPVCDPTPATSPRQLALVAGSGAALAFARAALQREPARVAASIGSRGAIAAVRAGAVDVGLSLRPGPADLVSHKLARVPLVLAVGGAWAGPPTRLASATAALHARLATASPSPASAVWVSREAGDSALRALAAARPGLAAALSTARDRGLALVAYTDQEQHALLAATPGAIGLVDLGTVRLTAAPLRTFSPEDPRLVLTLYALTARDPGSRARQTTRALRAFAASEEARRAGYRE